MYINGNIRGYKSLCCHQGTWDVSCSSCLQSWIVALISCSDWKTSSFVCMSCSSVQGVWLSERLMHMSHYFPPKNTPGPISTCLLLAMFERQYQIWSNQVSWGNTPGSSVWWASSFNHFLRALSTPKHYSDIVSGMPSGSKYGIVILAFYPTLFLAYTFWHSIWFSIYLASIPAFSLASVLPFSAHWHPALLRSGSAHCDPRWLEKKCPTTHIKLRPANPRVSVSWRKTCSNKACLLYLSKYPTIFEYSHAYTSGGRTLLKIPRGSQGRGGKKNKDMSLIYTVLTLTQSDGKILTYLTGSYRRRKQLR